MKIIAINSKTLTTVVIAVFAAAMLVGSFGGTVATNAFAFSFSDFGSGLSGFGSGSGQSISQSSTQDQSSSISTTGATSPITASDNNVAVSTNINTGGNTFSSTR